MFKSPYNIKGILNIKNTQQTVKKRTIQEPYLSQLKCQGSILIWNSSLHWLSWSRASQAAKFHWPGVPLRFLDHYFPCLGHFRALYLLHYFCRWFRCCIKYLYLPSPRPLWRPWADGGRLPAEHCIRPGHGRAASLLTTFRHQAPGPGSKWSHASTYRGLAAFTFYAQSWNETRKSIKAINC